ncbi:MAG: hypothetical protein B7Y45_06645 [Sphingomonas sp. 28-66-16]|nr:MAG: hypothetical protein B7Y45_06645 [Sphingomonas sp. 28-66-16]
MISAITAGDAASAKETLPAPAWTPLDFATFSQELGATWIPVPNGDSGAPRQGWLNTADGFFTREAHVAYSYTDAGPGDDAEAALVRFNYPLTRRLWAGVEVPFYQRARVGSYIGDIRLNTLVMLAETRNVSINAGVGWRIPTGDTRLGGDEFTAQPQINLWTDVGRGFSIRGRLGYEFGSRAVPDAFVLNATIGQTVTPHAKAPFGDLTWYVAGNYREATTGLGNSFVSITPGLRTHVGGNLFLLAGVEFPVTDTRQSFSQRYIVQLVQGF